MITQSRLKELLHYDQDTGIFKWIVKRSGVLKDESAGYFDSVGYITIKVEGRSYKSHRLAWLYMTGQFPEEMVDHKNLIRHDNRWINIRSVTRTINAQNQHHAHSQSKTGLLGVRVNGKKYQARINVYGKAILLGSYDSSIEAHESYLTAKRKLHEGVHDMTSPLIVAELSCNHNGSIDRALALIDAAAEAGADSVKFQTWAPGSMVKDRAYVMQSGPWAGQNLAHLYDEAWTPWDWMPDLIKRAKMNEIEWFSTPFDIPSLDFLESLGCRRYKISSFDIINLPLIRAAAATGKPLIISTGMATLAEIDDAVMAAAEAGCKGDDKILLKCTSAYPSDASDANLETMLALPTCTQSLTMTKFGLSDHTPGIGVAVAAAALGATVIEKHFTLLRADGGPDAAFSMEPDEFKQMVTACRQAAAAIGTVRYGPTEAEFPMLEVRRVRMQGK